MNRLILIIISPLLGFISIRFLRYYNSGIGGSLYSKRWYLRIGILALLLSIFSLVLYFINPVFIIKNFTNHFFENFGELKWFEIIVNGLIGAFISKAIDLIFSKKKKNPRTLQIQN